MSSERVKKKIVIRGVPATARRRMGRDSSALGAQQADTRTQEQLILDQLPEKDPDFQGELFEQFYSPLGKKENQGRLESIAAQPLEVVMPDHRLTSEEKEQLEKQYQRAAEALSKQIYHLAQVKRETNLDFYISAFDVVLGHETCEDAKQMLNRANAYFTKEYDSLIKERGERPDIYHQIVRRVGHNLDRIRRFVVGLDVGEAARNLWSVSREDMPEKQRKMRAILEDCTEKEVRALRREYTRIPAREICEQLSATLKAPTDSKAISKESADYWQRVRQAQAEAAARIRETLKFDLERLNYILRGRSAEDVQLLVAQFDLDYAKEDLTVTNLLRKQIEERLGELAKEPLQLLEGFDPVRAAQAIDSLIQSEDPFDVLEGRMNGSIFDTEDDIKLSPLYEHRFLKRRVYRNRGIKFDNLIDTREGLIAQIEYMTSDQFNLTNGLLFDNFGYKLNRNDYPLVADFDPRSRALALAETLKTRSRLRNIFQPLAYLNPLQCGEVKVAFQCITGENLREAVTNRIQEIYGDGVPEGIQKMMDNRIEGRLRWPLRIDMLARFRGDALKRNGSLGAWDLDEVATAETEKGALTIAEIINDEQLSPVDKGQQILEFMHGKSYQELNAIEYAFYELSDPSEPLLTTMKEFVDPDLVGEIAMRLAGLDVRSQAERMQEDLGVIYEMRNQPTDAIRITTALYKKISGYDLVATVKQCLANPDQEDQLVDVLSILYAPQASAFFSCLIRLGDETDAMLEEMKRSWTKKVVDAMAFEKACDYRFGRFRLVLKNLAAAGIIPKENFIDAVMHLEGIDPKIPELVTSAIKFNDIDTLMHLLDDHREDQRTIEEACDLILPNTTRRALMEMDIPLDLIHEAILHLDGYYSHDIAAELHATMQSVSGQELGEQVLDMLRDSSAKSPNPRIPEDINWSGEMLYQIRLAYEFDFKSEFIADLRDRQVPEELLGRITARIFGPEPTKLAFELFQLMRNELDESVWPKAIETLAARGMRARERVMEVYYAFFGMRTNKTALISDIQSRVSDSERQKNLMELLRPSQPAAGA